MAIKRIWHGWTTPGDAEAYRAVLLGEVLPGIEAKSVIDFQGQDYARAYVPEAARRILRRWDPTAAHYEVVDR